MVASRVGCNSSVARLDAAMAEQSDLRKKRKHGDSDCYVKAEWSNTVDGREWGFYLCLVAAVDLW